MLLADLPGRLHWFHLFPNVEPRKLANSKPDMLIKFARDFFYLSLHVSVNVRVVTVAHHQDPRQNQLPTPRSFVNIHTMSMKHSIKRLHLVWIYHSLFQIAEGLIQHYQ